MYTFEKLIVWNESRELVKMVYELVENYPSTEKYALIDQMKRASVGIVSNIAEGSARITPKDKGHFYSIAYSSSMELVSQIFISIDLGYTNSKKADIVLQKIGNVSRLLNGLRNSTLKLN